MNFFHVRTVLQVCCSIALFSLLLFVLSTTDLNRSIHSKYFAVLNPRNVTSRPQREGFLTSSFSTGMHGQLGNQIFELLSVIGVADRLNRIPYLSVANKHLILQTGYRIREIFPNLEHQFRIVYWNMTARGVSFNSDKCCVYDNPERLLNMTDDYVELQGSYFQSFKYFDHLRDDVRRWLLPNATIQSRALKHLPSNYSDHFKICVHIRRGDFQHDSYHQPSDGNFSRAALEYLTEKYKTEKMVSIVMGNDATWEKKVFEGLPNVHVMETSTPEEDLAFAQNQCDVVLITAPSSTFGFWLGYLSKSFDVYYRNIATTQDKVQGEMRQEDFFPVGWTRIRMEDDGSIEEDKEGRWPVGI